MSRYVLHPGYIFSKSDGDRHFIGAERLASLYGLPLAKCIIATRGGYRKQDGDIHLYPDYDGDYNIDNLKQTPDA